jgi:transposase-like protein
MWSAACGRTLRKPNLLHSRSKPCCMWLCGTRSRRQAWLGLAMTRCQRQSPRSCDPRGPWAIGPYTSIRCRGGVDPAWWAPKLRALPRDGSPMPRPRRFFPPEYKAEVVELIRSTGKTVGRVARELDLTETAVHEWVKRADLDAGRRTDASRLPNARNSASCVVRSEICARSARSCARPRFSSPGRPIAGELLPADRHGENTPPRLLPCPRARCVARGLLRLGIPSAVGPNGGGRLAGQPDS